MKKLFTIFAAVLITASVFAQSPEKMSYQAVIRNSSDQFITNQTVGMQISILQGSASGTAVYVETQTPTTNANGLVSFEIGAGTVVNGDFATIDWANGPYFIKTETDPTGSTSYTITGTSQLLSVPYALHAKTAEIITGGITEVDPTYTATFSITEPTEGDLLRYNATSERWEKFTPDYAAGTHSHTTTTDVADGFMSSADKKKLDGITTGANVNVNADWDATEGDAQILNKPDLEIYAPKAELDLKADKPQYYIGQEHLDGIIFHLYYDENGDQRGLVVSKTETTAKWQNISVRTDATRSWDGVYNMNLMSDSPAKDWVTDNFSTDWYLPSIDELSILWHNRFHANKGLSDAAEATLLSNTYYYWSSTEIHADYAFYFTFNLGNANYINKTFARSVRAVRAF